MDGEYNPKAAKNVPEGHRLLRPGEKIPAGKGAFKLQWFGSSTWIPSDGSLADTSPFRPGDFHISHIAVPTNPMTTVPKPKPKKPKAPKPVWSTKFLHIHPKSTKADLVKLLQEAVDQLNETGTKLVAAQNKLARLKAKA